MQRLLQTLRALFTPPHPSAEIYECTTRCGRCGETLTARINLYHDLSVEYNAQGEVSGYHCRKVLSGQARCFQNIEIVLEFDTGRKLSGREVRGGEFVEA